MPLTVMVDKASLAVGVMLTEVTSFDTVVFLQCLELGLSLLAYVSFLLDSCVQSTSHYMSTSDQEMVHCCVWIIKNGKLLTVVAYCHQRVHEGLICLTCIS